MFSKNFFYSYKIFLSEGIINSLNQNLGNITIAHETLNAYFNEKAFESLKLSTLFQAIKDQGRSKLLPHSRLTSIIGKYQLHITDIELHQTKVQLLKMKRASFLRNDKGYVIFIVHLQLLLALRSFFCYCRV